MTFLKQRVGKMAALLALVAASVLLGAGCASSGGNPNATKFQFPGDDATPAPAQAQASGSAEAPAPLAEPASPAAQPVAVPPKAQPGRPVAAPPTNFVAASSLRVGDMISVSFSDVPPPGLVEVRARIPDDGMLQLHNNVRVRAAGVSIPELERTIRAAYVPSLYRNLTAIVRADDRYFYVGGEVKTPNRYKLESEMTVLRAIDSANGFTEFADHNDILLRRQDGSMVTLSEKKIRKNQQVDLPVMPNDHITVKRRFF